MAKEREEPAAQSEDTQPQWQPPGAATRSLTLAEVPAIEHLRRSGPPPAAPPAPSTELELATPPPPPSPSTEMELAPPPAPLRAQAVTPASAPEPVAPAISGVRTGSVSDPMAYQHTLSAETSGPAEGSLLGVGDTIGERYIVEQVISSGGFGTVYRAKDRQIANHEVAIKLLHKPAASEQERESALRELTLIASVSHPSVVQFKDYGWQLGRLWFAMPWYKGQTLDKRYDDGAGQPALTRREARPLFERLALGLAAMHDVGIHHHDIKPENIFVADIAGFEGGLPVLLDLGIAAKRGEGPKGLTPEYAAPEIAASALGDKSRPIGSMADVFSLALVLRNFLEPETAPKVGDELVPLLHARANEPIPKFERRELRYLQPVFERWLSLDPVDRPSAGQLGNELAVLTEPEERREARVRILRRVVPVVLVAALTVAVLWIQVLQQRTQITAQAVRINQEQQKSQVLSQRSSEQLQQLEAQNEQIGTQGERLQRAIGIGRQLGERLQQTEREVDSLTRRVRKLGDERDALQKAGDALRVEIAALTEARSQLTHERDELVGARDALQAEQRRLTGERDTLQQEREGLLSQKEDLVREQGRLHSELLGARKSAENANVERDATRKAYEELREEVQGLRSQVRDLKQERDRLEAASRRNGRGDAPAEPAPGASPGDWK
ncbi:MAG TPA: protein kinase [Polyangiales bacterium]|nr:protein kinase [Polyangiales bacterium]